MMKTTNAVHFRGGLFQVHEPKKEARRNAVVWLNQAIAG
jgi:hypothetical protein